MQLPDTLQLSEARETRLNFSSLSVVCFVCRPCKLSIFGDPGILMDVEGKYPGYTHVALKLASVEQAEQLFQETGVAITGRRSFRGVDTVFIRDPDRNVLELVGPGPTVSELIRDHVRATEDA